MSAENHHSHVSTSTTVAAAASLKKSKETVSTMLKQGFIPPDPYLSLSRLSPTSDPTRPTRQSLFDMMSEEQIRESARSKTHDRVTRILQSAPFNDPGYRVGSDVRLTVSGRDGYRVSIEVHGDMLAGKSRFFRERLSGQGGGGSVSHDVEICECDDVEVYVETVVLMYCDDLRRRLLGEDVTKVLALLKVSSAIMFDDGIASCLEFLEAVPWSEGEEEKVISQLTQLHLEDSIPRVLQRVSAEPSTSSRTDNICLKLFNGVLQAKDDKARREMKALIFSLLKEHPSNHNNTLIDISKDTLYYLCHGCLSALILCLSEASSVNDGKSDRGAFMKEIAREADNMQWVVDVLIQQKVGDEFVKLWADQKELAILHLKIPIMYRHEISRITAQLCVAIGRGEILVPREIRYSLLGTWLEALYEDFGWMRRACRSIDKNLIEDGLSQTILTLSLPQQQAILLDWFDRFLNKGDDCPNIQRAFEVWWRRAFVRQYVAEPMLQLAVCDFTN